MLEGLHRSSDEVLLAQHAVPGERGLEVVHGPRGRVHIVLDRVRQLGLLLLQALDARARSRT